MKTSRFHQTHSQYTIRTSIHSQTNMISSKHNSSFPFRDYDAKHRKDISVYHKTNMNITFIDNLKIPKAEIIISKFMTINKKQIQSIQLSICTDDLTLIHTSSRTYKKLSLLSKHSTQTQQSLFKEIST